MSKPVIIFAGFSLSKHLKEARSLFPSDSYEFVCIQGRAASPSKKENYLSLFDQVYDIDSIPTELASRVQLVTCTQERDMGTYLRALRTLGRIDDEQYDLWGRVINKLRFKEKMAGHFPELVPQVFRYDPADLSSAASLVFPLVIKPTNLTGSAFVRVIHDQVELTAYTYDLDKYLAAGKLPNRTLELVVEEFVVGPQYSMNVYISPTGNITYCPPVRVVPAFELGHDDTYSALQYNTTLPDEQATTLRSAIAAIVSTFRIQGTSAHFDCILSPTGWKICEVGLRIGGKRQELFATSHGFSHFKNDLLNRLGQDVDLGEQKAILAIIQKAPDHFGYLESINYPIPGDPDLIFEMNKQKAPDPKAGPIASGGVTAFRAFLSGDNEKTVVEEAQRIFQDTSFSFNDQP